jgi:hypothetical protein
MKWVLSFKRGGDPKTTSSCWYEKVTPAMTNPKIKLQIMVNGAEVRGKILHLFCNDTEVQITSPFKGEHQGIHIPWFMMEAKTNHLCTSEGEIMEYGIGKAEIILEEIYLRCLKDRRRRLRRKNKK